MTDASQKIADQALVDELAKLIVDALNLDVSAAEIDADAPLFGQGLGLDSIDSLEIAMMVALPLAVRSLGFVPIDASVPILVAVDPEHRQLLRDRLDLGSTDQPARLQFLIERRPAERPQQPSQG